MFDFTGLKWFGVGVRRIAIIFSLLKAGICPPGFWIRLLRCLSSFSTKFVNKILNEKLAYLNALSMKLQKYQISKGQIYKVCHYIKSMGLADSIT